MNRNTKLLFIFSFFLILIAICWLFIIETKSKTIEFYAVIVDANKEHYIVVPFKDSEFINDYSGISIKLDTGLKVGDIVKIKAENTILETYPPIMNAISYIVVFPTQITNIENETNN